MFSVFSSSRKTQTCVYELVSADLLRRQDFGIATSTLLTGSEQDSTRSSISMDSGLTMMDLDEHASRPDRTRDAKFSTPLLQMP